MSPPLRPVKCVRKSCNKCLYCNKVSAKCECREEDKVKDPVDVMYGWCRVCRVKFKEEYEGLVGNNCTYCGGPLEDNYPPAAVALGVLCFPCGLVACCMLQEKQCVKCNRSFA